MPLRAKPTMPAIQARLAHSQLIGRAQSACWPPRATGPVDTLRAPPLSAHLGDDVTRVSASREQRPVLGAYSGNRFKLNSAELDRDPAFAVRCGDPDRGHVVVRTNDVGVGVGALHELGFYPLVVGSARIPADVLARLVTQAACQVEVRTVGVREV